MIGQVIGNYKIEEKLGEGGMGSVYKGVDTMLDREVAIKALKPELARQTEIVERFRKEAVTLAKLNHPNIATLYSLFRHGDELYMVLEYVRGRTLDEILTRRGALEADEVVPVFCQILDGIHHAHEYGIIHRDIKPANMMLTENGTLKVLDFGIARLLGSNRMTRAGNIIGTLEYMAPEQVKGLDTDARSDTYALGMMLYEVLTGRTPFDTENEFELMKQQTESLPPHPRSIKPSVPLEVEAAIMRAIQKDPNDRFQTAGEFREALLAAGYPERGVLKRITQPNREISHAPSESYPPISRPESVEPPSTSGDPIKETRFAAPVAGSHPVEVKETRLGTGFAAPVSHEATTVGPSFLSRLTWIHYAGAAFAGVVFLGFLFIVPLVIFSGRFSASNSSAPEPTKTVEAPPKTVGAATPAAAPVSEPTPIVTEEPRRPAPIVVKPVDENPTPTNPVDETPPPRKSVGKPPSDTRSAPPPTKKPAQPKAPAKSRNKSLKDARCALTGDC